MCVGAPVEVRDRLQESVLFCHMGPRGKNQVDRFNRKCFHLLRHLTSPKLSYEHTSSPTTTIIKRKKNDFSWRKPFIMVSCQLERL